MSNPNWTKWDTGKTWLRKILFIIGIIGVVYFLGNSLYHMLS